LSDETLSCGTGGELEPDAPGELELDPLLPQAAATRAALAATAVRAILLLKLKSNETTSFVGTACMQKMRAAGLGRFEGRYHDYCQVNRRLRGINVAINIAPPALKYR